MNDYNGTVVDNMDGTVTMSRVDFKRLVLDPATKKKE